MHARLLAPVRGWEARRALRAARVSADRELIAARLPSPRLAWRTAELVSDEHRIELARDLTELLHAADGRLLPGSAPIDRVAVRAARAQLLLLAGRLSDLEHGVEPRGILLVERLFDGGPVYGRRAGSPTLQRAVCDALGALERSSVPGH